MQRTKILLIVGSLRSGSTILGNVLGQIDGFLSVGELADVWVNVWHNQGMCGCGDKATSCELWRPIFEQSLGDPDDVPGYAMYHEGRKALRTGSLPLMAMPLTRKQLLAHIGDYLSVTRALHRAIAEQTAARVIVDHSKYPAYRYVLEALDQFDLYVLHLVRDPRGVVYSWLRRKAHRGGPKGHMYENPLLTSVKWLVWNGAAEFFSHAKPQRYLRVRYEDFVRAPRSMIERVGEFIGEGPLEVPFVEGSSAVDLEVTHTVAGNPNRFVTGRVEMRVDQQWVRFMPRKFRLLTLAVTFPLLHRYGYRYRAAFRSPEREGAIQTRGARLVELARSTGVPRERRTRGRHTGTYHAGRGSDRSWRPLRTSRASDGETGHVG